jgi:hypothetical protein
MAHTTQARPKRVAHSCVTRVHTCGLRDSAHARETAHAREPARAGAFCIKALVKTDITAMTMCPIPKVSV